MKKIVALFALTCLTLIANPALAAELNGGLIIAAPEVGAVAPAAALAFPDSCYLTEVKECCDAAGATLSKECMADGVSWFCFAGVIENPLVTTTKKSKLGFTEEKVIGQRNCKFKAPTCGSSPGRCGTANQVTTKSCTVKKAAGALCRTPDTPITY